MLENDKGVQSTIKLLNRFGHNVIEIEGRYFITTQFEEAGPNNWKHTITNAIDIGTIIEQYHHINSLDDGKRDEIEKKIFPMPKEKKSFHRDCKFIFHFAQ